MNQIAEKLQQIIRQASQQLSKITEEESTRRPAREKWSKKEILGHLIDSASNNHQRFVRAQETQVLSFPAYTQNFWVSSQAYQTEPWKDLVGLWTSYNTHLAHLVTNIPEERWDNVCHIANNQPITLKSLAEDYVRHAKHHLEQILGNEL